jgi:hypothetical protein
MSLLSEIQESLLVEGASLEFPLLKLRVLASRMGSDVLEDWVRHEIAGYPEGVEVPDYRRTGIIFRGTFANDFQVWPDKPIPNAIIAKHGGSHWLSYEFRQGIGVIDGVLARPDKPSEFSIDAANLLLIIQDKIYDDKICIDLRGLFNGSAFVKIRSAVRARMLELTIKLEREIPEAKNIALGTTSQVLPQDTIAVANKATQSVIYNYNGPVTNISNAGPVADLSVNVAQGNIQNLITELVQKGIPDSEAREFARIMEAEKPDNSHEPFGRRARKWLHEKVEQAGGMVWGMTKGIVTNILTEAAKKYYGL